MSIKTERLANLLIKEISSILMTEIKDEDIKFVTITHLDLSSDLSYAKVYCTVLNDENRDKCIHDLNGAKGFIRSELMKRKLEMRKIPELHFVFDESIDYGNKIEKIINKMYMQIIQKQLDYTMKKVTNMVGLAPKKYRVRDMKSAWGSCSSTKNISIALKLIEYSPKAFEYVVLHEVCHLKHMNHSKQFWQMVEGYMPDYKKYKKELNSSKYDR